MPGQRKVARRGSFAIETRALTKRYGGLAAVDTLDLMVRRGEIYGLLGPNGAGKTTLIRVLCGLATASSGSAYVLGRRLPDKSVTPLLGYMPQETALYPGLTVHENMMLHGQIFGLDAAARREREARLLSFIGLKRWSGALVGDLSGGMKRRVSLACALVHEPELLFLDEPTVGVDPDLRASFWEYFTELRSRGVTILMTTHYMDEARHCDRIGMMRSGRLIAEGTPAQLLRLTGTRSLDDAFLRFSSGGGA